MRRAPGKDDAFRRDAGRMVGWLCAQQARRYGADIMRALAASTFLLRDVVSGPPHGSPGSSTSLAWLQHASPATRDPETASTGNKGEAAAVGALAACLLTAAEWTALPSGGDADDDGPARVVVITPYLHHKVLLEIAIAKGLEALTGVSRGRALHRVTSSGIVNTADSFQGQVRKSSAVAMMAQVDHGETLRAATVGGRHCHSLYCALTCRRSRGWCSHRWPRLF